MISKRNSLGRAIEDLKHRTRQDPIECRQGFVEHERAFGRAYRSYRVDGRSRMDVDTFFSRIKGELISLINRELTDLNSARVQMTTWIRFIQEFNDLVEINRVEKAFNSRMVEVHQGSDLGRIVDGMITHMKTQIENPTLANSRFRFDETLFLDVSFHWLTRGSSYVPLPDWIAKKKVIINPQNDDEGCFKWAVIAVLEIGKDPQCMSTLKKFENNYDWSGLEFPVTANKINVFKRKNYVSVTILALKGPEVYIARSMYSKGRMTFLLLYWP